MAYHERVLRGGIDRRTLLAHIRDRDIGLHRVRVRHREVILAFDNCRSVLEGGLYVAPLDFMLLADVAAAPGRDLSFEAAERTRLELLLVQQRRVLRKRFLRRENGFELLVFDLDEFERLERSALIDGNYGSDGFSGVADLPDRKQRMIFNRVTVVRIQSLEIIAGDHTVDAGTGCSTRSVDRDDFSVRVRAA